MDGFAMELNPKPLLEQIHRQQITGALLSFSLDDFGWKGGRPTGVFDALLQSYALVSETAELHIYRPR